MNQYNEIANSMARNFEDCGLPIFLTNKRLSALSFKFFKETSPKKCSF